MTFIKYAFILLAISTINFHAQAAEEVEATTMTSQCEQYGSYQDESAQWLTCENEEASDEEYDLDQEQADQKIYDDNYEDMETETTDEG